MARPCLGDDAFNYIRNHRARAAVLGFSMKDFLKFIFYFLVLFFVVKGITVVGEIARDTDETRADYEAGGTCCVTK